MASLRRFLQVAVVLFRGRPVASLGGPGAGGLCDGNVAGNRA